MHPNTLPEKITAAITGLLYISESEAPVELLDWPGILTIEVARQHIATLNGHQPEDQTLRSTEDFMRPILQMATPEDPVMEEYANRWGRLLRKLQRALHDVQIIAGPVKEAHQQLYIVGFTDAGALALHTSAVIT